jgi:hypothetical protein
VGAVVTKYFAFAASDRSCARAMATSFSEVVVDIDKLRGYETVLRFVCCYVL